MEEFLKPMSISAYRLSKDTEISQSGVSQILKANGRIKIDTTLRLNSYFGHSPKICLGLQDDFDIELDSKVHAEIFTRICRIRKNAQQLRV